MNLKKFEDFKNDEREVSIDGFKYIITKSNIDISKFDYDGSCEEYMGSYVVIEVNDDEEDTDRIRVREFDGTIYDDNNDRTSFDPDNYSNDIHARLNYGDECYTDELYTIIATNNRSGSVFYKYLGKNIIHPDLTKIYKDI